MSKYIDIGANLTGSSFRADLSDVIDRALETNVTHMIVTGSTVDDSRSAIELCEVYESVLYSTVGVHPHHADEFGSDTIDELRALSENERVVAIGECGLDFNRNYSISGNQISAFEQQLELASEIKKPVFLHQRDAHDDFFSIVKNTRSGLVNAVAHCFTGTAQEASEYIDLGLYIGVTGRTSPGIFTWFP